MRFLCLAAVLFIAQAHAYINRPNVWIDTDYLYWKIQNSPEHIPLVIQGQPSATPSPVLGSPGTSVVLGGSEITTGWRSGGQVALGFWFDRRQNYGLEGSYFFLPQITTQFSANYDSTSPFLLVPFYNTVTGAEDSINLTSPLLEFGGTNILKLTNGMQGAELNLLANIPSDSCYSRFIASVGFLYWYFGEKLTFSTNNPFFPPHVVDTYMTKDRFNVKNNFFGGALDLMWKYNQGRFSIYVKGKIALGAMLENLKISGYLLTNDYNGYGNVLQYPGGYFALPTNMGNYSQTQFAAIPEVSCNLGVRLLDWMRLRVGYTFLYVTNLLWAGNQINQNINPTQASTYAITGSATLSGASSPTASFNTESLWAQGLNVGLEFSY